MRTEDIVGVTFFAVLFGGLALILYGLVWAKGSRQRCLREGLGLAVDGLALVAFGFLTFYFIRNSVRPVVEGNIWAVRGSFSGGRSLTRFNVTSAQGGVVAIICHYEGPGFQEGERARVRYVEYNRTLLEMDMLTGPYGAWHLRQSSGEWGYLGLVVIGVACGAGGFRQLRKAEQEGNKAEGA